jgi:hypothetical protein
MNEKYSTWLRIVLYAGMVLLTACVTKSNPTLTSTKSGARCDRNEASCNILGGYIGNTVADEVTGATISGGGMRGAPNQVTGNYATVGGGKGNLAGEGSTVGGGSGNTAEYFHATVGGGANNLANAQEATVAGGFKNTASERFATVGGGSGNIASDINATVSGGSGNIANYRFATVGGGTQNLASSLAAVVSGGDHNLAQGAYSSILGGINNIADGYLATIGGGIGNTATGSYAVTPGGFANAAGGDYSFAAGRSAKINAKHAGTFLFADSNPFSFPSLAPNEFATRATGGVRFVTGVDSSGDPTSGVRLSPGSGAWESLSDYNAKAGFAPVDGRQVLEQLMSVPISTWHYRSQDPSIRHIGPMAQDFYAAFNVGEDNRYISTVDEEGVALAAIQELYRMVQQKNTGMAAPQSEDLLLQKQIASLEKRLAFSNGLAVASFLIAILALWRRVPTERINR